MKSFKYEIYAMCEHAQHVVIKSDWLSASPFANRLPKSFNHVVGETAEVTCKAWGVPAPKITWFRKSNEESEASEQLSSGGNFTIVNLASSNSSLTENQLTIGNLSFPDYGIYTCNATNDHGLSASVTKIRVKGK